MQAQYEELLTVPNLPQPLLKVSVATFAHRGMLGIAIVPLSTAVCALSNHGNANSLIMIIILSHTFSYTILKPRLIPVMILQKENNHWVTSYIDMN